ncbi:unnamed protein product [Onchocerca ochengi]|uniref:Uncharacterized protein n=1 Tax=Onchocerca ochengi TaxID=42157 RepID=A0A182EFT2_ONCOC|nr:unnamed protein product [Onchocerca ochengi]
MIGEVISEGGGGKGGGGGGGRGRTRTILTDHHHDDDEDNDDNDDRRQGGGRRNVVGKSFLQNCRQHCMLQFALLYHPIRAEARIARPIIIIIIIIVIIILIILSIRPDNTLYGSPRRCILVGKLPMIRLPYNLIGANTLIKRPVPQLRIRKLRLQRQLMIRYCIRPKII